MQTKKEKKLASINNLVAENKADQERFENVKKEYRVAHEAKTRELKREIENGMIALSEKEQEFSTMNDTLLKRTKHYQALAKIEEEIAAAEEQHREMITELEDNLRQQRLQLQEESSRKIEEIREVAQEVSSISLRKPTSISIPIQKESQAKTDA